MPKTQALPVQWNLAQYLERQRVTPHALMKETGLSPNTIYPIVRGEAKAVSLETLGVIAAGIESLTGHRPDVKDLFEITDLLDSKPGAKLAELLKHAKPPLTAEQLLGPDDWTEEELEAGRQAELEMQAEKKKLRVRVSKRELELLRIMSEEPLEAESVKPQ